MMERWANGPQNDYAPANQGLNPTGLGQRSLRGSIRILVHGHVSHDTPIFGGIQPVHNPVACVDVGRPCGQLLDQTGPVREDGPMWSRFFTTACGVVAAALCTPLTPVHACSIRGNQPYAIDPQAQATDTTAPTAPVVTVESITRGPASGACSGSSCDGVGRLVLQVSATDDQTAPASLGYRIELSSGRLPSGLVLPNTAVHSATVDGLLFVWDDGTGDDKAALAFGLSVRAVDLAGNESPPTAVTVSDPGSGGCSIGGHNPWDSAVALVAAVFLIRGLLRRARERQGHCRDRV
jgi:hypothetical protein